VSRTSTPPSSASGPGGSGSTIVLDDERLSAVLDGDLAVVDTERRRADG
jgi:hypothetical protein